MFSGQRIVFPVAVARLPRQDDKREPELKRRAAQAVLRLSLGRFQAVSMLSPGCLQVVSSFLTVSEFQIGSNRFLLLPICLPECHFLWFCASQTCNSFDLWRSNGCDVLQKFLAEETCLLLVPQRVVAVYYCVITAVYPDFNCRCEAHSSPSISPGHWAETWKILEVSLVFLMLFGIIFFIIFEYFWYWIWRNVWL